VRSATIRYIGHNHKDKTMFIVWGKTIKRQKLGFVADYCALCRDLRTFEVKRVGQASHLYYISFGEGELLGYERTCQDCRTVFETVPDHYRSMARDRRPPVELITETFPNYYSAYQDEIAAEKKVRNSPSLLTPNERRARLWEPFALMAQANQQKLKSMQLDWQVGVAFAAMFPIIWLFGAVEGLILKPDVAEDPRFFLAGLFLSLGIIGWQMIGSGRRYLLKHAVPPLVQSIAPLRPSLREIEEVLGQLKLGGMKLGSKLEAKDLHEPLERLRQQV
jgi:hypothetical protein